MLAREVPTSPLFRNSPSEPQIKKTPDFFRWLLFMLLVGAFAGSAAAVIFVSFFLRQVSSFSDLESGTVFRISEKVTDRQSGFFQNWEKTRQGLVLAVTRVPVMQDVFVVGPIRSENVLGTGLILTDDGWLLFPKGTFGKEDGLIEVVLSDQRIFEVKQSFEDPLTSMIFARIDADRLTPVEFFPKSSIATGLETLVFSQQLDGRPEMGTAVLKNPTYHQDLPSNEIIFSSDDVSIRFLFASSFKEDRGVVTSLDGRVMGFVEEEGDRGLVVTPAFWIQPILGSVFSQRQLQRVHLGVRWMNLERSPFLWLNPELGNVTGALISSGTTRAVSIEPKSPASIAGLRDGDIITKVNGQELRGFDDLSASIQALAPKSRAELTIVRGSEEIKISVEL